MSPDLELLMKHLRDRTADVELTLPDALPSGDRLARVFPLVNGQRSAGAVGVPTVEVIVSDAGCRKLLAAGATWVGRSEDKPSTKPYIEQLSVRNYRCIKDASIPLTPLHAFIGPNDGGKSTLLDAIRSLALSGGSLEAYAEVVGSWQGNSFARSGGEPGIPASVTVDGPAGQSAALLNVISAVRFVRMDPDAMRRPAALIPPEAPIEYDTRGAGLAAVYHAFQSRRLNVFTSISRRFVTLFPAAQAIQLTSPDSSTTALGVQLIDGTRVDASRTSDGMLYWLAFAALRYLYPVPLILVEAPENGLHPSSIAEVMRILRAISTQSQVIIATHSPLVVNELQADEVTLITRTPERGTIATPRSKTHESETTGG